MLKLSSSVRERRKQRNFRLGLVWTWTIFCSKLRILVASCLLVVNPSYILSQPCILVLPFPFPEKGGLVVGVLVLQFSFLENGGLVLASSAISVPGKRWVGIKLEKANRKRISPLTLNSGTQFST